MTLAEAKAAQEQGAPVEREGARGTIVHITKAGKIQIRYFGQDARPRIGVDPTTVELAQ